MAGQETTKQKQRARKRPADAAPLPRGPYAVSADVVAADQRRRLLEALPVVVAKHGFEGATVDQIVKVAQVRRNSFYEQFSDKRDCFAAAYEIAQERLLGVLTYQCYARASLVARVSFSLRAVLDLLAAEPELTQLVMVEAPGVSGTIAARHHEWLDRYGRLLSFAVLDSPGLARPTPGVEPAVVGGVVSRVRQQVLAGKAKRLPELGPELTQFVLSFYGTPKGAAPSTNGSAAQEEPQPQSPDLSPALEPA